MSWIAEVGMFKLEITTQVASLIAITAIGLVLIAIGVSVPYSPAFVADAYYVQTKKLIRDKVPQEKWYEEYKKIAQFQSDHRLRLFGLLGATNIISGFVLGYWGLRHSNRAKKSG